MSSPILLQISEVTLDERLGEEKSYCWNYPALLGWFAEAVNMLSLRQILVFCNLAR